jgi:hypothetical protein
MASANRGPTIPTKRRPALPFTTAVAPDPTDAVTADPDDVEEQTNQTLDALQSGYREQERKQEQEAKALAPIEFFRVLVFLTPEQAQAFAKAVGMDEHQQYMDGRVICDRLGIAIPPDVWSLRKSLITPSKRWSPLAMPLKSEKA